MNRNCKLVTPPSPLLFASGDSRGVRVPVSCSESISLELIDSKGVGGRTLGVAPGHALH